MGGGSSQLAKKEKSTTTPTIPAAKRYDVKYLTQLLLTASTEQQSDDGGERSGHDNHDAFTLALAACNALQNVSGSYAYSE